MLYTFTVRSKFRPTEKSQACFSAQGYIGYCFKYPNPIPNIWQLSCIVGNVEGISDSAALKVTNNCYSMISLISHLRVVTSQIIEICVYILHILLI